jgi:ankyrin repeat protein
MIAAQEDRLEIVEELLVHGADANAQDYNDCDTALILACLFCNVGVVKLLLQHQANVHIANIDGMNGLMKSCVQGTHSLTLTHSLLLTHSLTLREYRDCK